MEDCYEIFKQEIERLSYLYVKANTKSKKKRLAYDLISFEDMYNMLSLEEMEFPWSNDPILNEVRYETADILVDRILEKQTFLIKLVEIVFNLFLNCEFSIYGDYGKKLQPLSEELLQKYLVCFFEQIEDGLGNKYLDKLDNSEIIINDRMKKYGGVFFPMEAINKNIIFFATEEYISVEEGRLLAHELGHNFEFDNASKSGDNNTWFKIVKTIYSEVSSCFFEYGFINYLIDNYICREDALILKRRYLNQIFDYMSYLLIIFAHSNLNIDYEFNIILDRQETVDYANHLLEVMNSHDELYKIGDKISFRNAFIYGIGKLFGVYVYECYKEKPKEFLMNFKTALLEYRNTGIKAFEELGITEESLLKADVLKRTLKDCK